MPLPPIALPFDRGEETGASTGSFLQLRHRPTPPLHCRGNREGKETTWLLGWEIIIAELRCRRRPTSLKKRIRGSSPLKLAAAVVEYCRSRSRRRRYCHERRRHGGLLLRVSLPPVYPLHRGTEDKEERDAAAEPQASSMPLPLATIVTAC
nr:hypothetical protein Iba_scaffold5979CG0010 [Ipomoea batatas]